MPSAACIVPLTIPGGKPVTAEPGLRPRSPLTTLGPVFVTVEPPKTAKPLAVLRFTEVAAKACPGRLTTSVITASRVSIEYLVKFFMMLIHFCLIFYCQQSYLP